MIPFPELKRFARAHISRPLFVVLSGSHAYGFPSKNSDFDMRASHIANTRDLLGLHRPNPTIEQISEDKRFDLVSHEIGKLLNMLLSPSGYILEQIHSPYPIITTPAFVQLKKLSKLVICKRIHSHYSGFAMQMYKLASQEGWTNIKRNLYLLRVLMSGITLLETGKIEVRIQELNKRFGVPFIDELVEAKREDEPARIEIRIKPEVDKLFTRLETAYKESKLPDNVQKPEKFNDWLIKLRMKNLR
jgi:predicted nucleotidyltransferase